jgi:hypothetical protein
MWILKNSKDLLEYIQSRSISSYNSINTFDFSTLYTTIPHSKLKDRLRELVQLCFIKQNGQRKYKCLVPGRNIFYFVKQTLWFYHIVLWNWYHQHARVFDWQHICYLWWTCFSTDSRHTYEYKLCSSPRCYNIDDVLSLNTSRFGDFVDRIYPIKLEIKDTTDTDSSASYLDLHLEIDRERRLRTKLYDKRDYFNFPFVNFPFICSNIPAAPAYGRYISLLIR